MNDNEPDLPGLPPKLYYSIREVAEYTEVKPHVLRYWEQEFPSLRPRKNRAGNRSYRRRDIQEVLTIRKLLYEDGFKIDGARRLLRQEPDRTEQLDLLGKGPEQERRAKLRSMRKELAELLESIRRL